MKKIYIFGAGNNGKKLLAYLERVGNQEVTAFIDNNIQNVEIDGLECISVEEAIRRGAQSEIIFVSPEKSYDIEKQLEDNGFKCVFCTNEWMHKKEFCFPITLKKSDYCRVKPFNHYESPYPDIKKVHENEKAFFDIKKEILDIDFNVDNQFELIDQMKNLDLPQWENSDRNKDYRYFYTDQWFGKGSADALFYMIRILQPKKIIEVGSGFSTAVMLDANEYFFNNSIEIVSIEPRANRLKSILKSTDNIEIYEKEVQEMPISLFLTLKENDILFIDSSHVSRIDSDVNFLFFEVLPRLKKGVYIHFHDIFYPFVYPKEWVYEGRAYNEMYILRAFLMNNDKYEIKLFGHMLECEYRNRIPEKLRGCGAGSLWIRKKG